MVFTPLEFDCKFISCKMSLVRGIICVKFEITHNLSIFYKKFYTSNNLFELSFV